MSRVDEYAEALRTIRSTWDGATRGGGPACGMDVVERAYVNMQTSWFAELGVYLELLGSSDGQ